MEDQHIATRVADVFDMKNSLFWRGDKTSADLLIRRQYFFKFNYMVRDPVKHPLCGRIRNQCGRIET